MGVIESTQSESITVSRTGELKRMQEEMRERYGD